MFEHKDVIEDVAESADQQATIEAKLADFKHVWGVAEYDFTLSPKGTVMLTGEPANLC